jgi:hypothetical protein
MSDLSLWDKANERTINTCLTVKLDIDGKKLFVPPVGTAWRMLALYVNVDLPKPGTVAREAVARGGWRAWFQQKDSGEPDGRDETGYIGPVAIPRYGDRNLLINNVWPHTVTTAPWEFCICVYAYASTSTGPTDWYTNAVADASGAYSIEGLPSDTYTLRVVPGQYCSDSDLIEQNGRQVAVTAGSPVAGIDFALAKPASAAIATPTSGAAPTTKTPSANLAVSVPVITGSTITTTFTASGPGTATQSGVVASGKRFARAGVTVCSVRATVKKAGKVKLACVLNAAGKRLRKKGALKVLLTTTFAPKKGAKATSTRTVTIPKR